MIRATTPIHTFIFSVNPEEVFTEILITYTQNGTIILEKHKTDLIFGSETSDNDQILYTASYRLSQEETKKFDPTIRYVNLQLRCLDVNGHAMATQIRRISIYDVLNDEVLI